jgi:hypothetical protein
MAKMTLKCRDCGVAYAEIAAPGRRNIERSNGRCESCNLAIFKGRAAGQTADVVPVSEYEMEQLGQVVQHVESTLVENADSELHGGDLTPRQFTNYSLYLSYWSHKGAVRRSCPCGIAAEYRRRMGDKPCELSVDLVLNRCLVGYYEDEGDAIEDMARLVNEYRRRGQAS